MALSAGEIKRAELRGWLVLLTFGALFIPAFTFFSGSGLRFVVYLLPAISLFFWLLSSASHRFLTDNRFIVAIMIYALLPVIGAFMQSEVIDKTTWINAFRPLFYLAIFIPFMMFSDKSVKTLIVIFGLATAALWFSGSGTTRGELDLGESRGLLESGLAFPLGGVLIYCILRKQKLWAFITFILFFIAFKRIAIGAVGLILGMIWLNALIHHHYPTINRYRMAALSLLIFASLTTLINIYYLEFFTLIARLLDTQQSVSYLTMGRLEEFDILYHQYGDQPLLNLLLGNGAGDATRKLVEITITYPLQVHNSFLLYFYDYGVIGFALLMTAFLVIFSRTRFGLYLLAYNIIIMVTDNTFSHHYHQITYFILIAAMHYETQKERLENHA